MPRPILSMARSLGLKDVHLSSISFDMKSEWLTTKDMESRPEALCHAIIVVMKEVLHGQLLDILDGLNESLADRCWTYVGVGRDDGRTAGEYNPIIFNTRVFSMHHFRTIWLSPTPQIPSRGWDAGCNRILTVAILRHQHSGRSVIVANTHLDNVGHRSRVESAKMILMHLKNDAEIKRIRRSSKAGIILTGDFNSKPKEDAYRVFRRDGFLRDVSKFVALNRHYGEHDTYTGFGQDTGKEEQGRIDFIWHGPFESLLDKQTDCSMSKDCDVPSLIGVEGYAVLPNKFQAGICLSDHRAVVADLVLN